MPKSNESLKIVDRGVVAVGRLQKKLDKQKLINHSLVKELEHYKHVMSVNIHLETRHKLYTDLRDLRVEYARAQTRIHEQSLLIKKLTGE
jgi:hypothetical protein